MHQALKREDLDGYLFSTTPPTTAIQKQKKQSMTGPRSQSASDFNKSIGQHLNRSNNKTREDLEELIEEIPFPTEVNLSLTSFTNSSNSNNTPQKITGQIETQSKEPGNVFGTSEHRKPPTLQTSAKSIVPKTLQYSNERGPNTRHNSASLQRALQFDFGNNVILEEMNGSDSLTPSHMNKLNDWSVKHVTPSSNSIFPHVIAPSIDISGEHSHSKLNFKEADLSRSVNDNQNLTIDHIVEKESSAQKQERTSIRQLVEDSKYKVQAKLYQEQKSNLENELNVQRKIYSKLEQENNYLCQRIGELEEHLGLIQARDKGSLESIRGNNLQIARTKIKQVSSLLEKKEQKINELTIQIQELQKNEQSYKKNYDHELTELHTNIQRLQILTQHHQQRAAELEQKFGEEFQRKNNSVDALQQQLSQQAAQIGRLAEEIKQRESKAQKQSTYCLELENLLSQASSKLEEREQEVERLKKSQENLLFDHHQTANLQIDKSWENKFYALEEELNKIKSLSQRQINTLKDTISQQKDQMQVLEETLLKKEATSNPPLTKANQSMNGLEGMLLHDDGKAHAQLEEMKAQYEMEIAIYKAQVEELHRRLTQAELDGVDKSGTQDSMLKGTTKLTISQSTACNLYLEPLHDIMVTFELYDTTCGFEDGLSKLRDYVQSLNEKVQTQSRDIFEAKKKEITLTSNLNHAQNDAEHLRDHNNKLQSRENELMQKISSLHNEMTELKKNAFSLESQLRIGQMNNNTSKFSPSKCDISDIQSNDYYREYLQITEEYKSLQSDYQSAQEKIRKLESQCQNLDFELKRTDAQLSRAREDAELLQLQMKSQAMGTEKSHSEEVKKTLNERINSLESRNENLMEQLKDSEVALLETRERIVLLEAERNSLVKDNSSSQEGLKKNLSDKVASLERKNRELAEELKMKQADLEQMRSEWQNLAIRFESQNTSSEYDIATKDFKLTTQIEMVNRLEEENLKALRDINSLKEKLENRSLEIQRLMTEKNTLTLENDRLNLLLSQEKGANEKLATLSENLSLREQEVQDLKHQSILINEEYQRTRLLCAELEEREAEGMKKVQQLQNTLREKQNELKHVIESARKKEEADAHTSAELANKIKELEKSKALIAQHEKSIEALKEERNGLKKKSEQLETSLKKLQDETKSKEDAVKQLEDKTEKNSKFLHEKDKKNVELFNLNKSLQENLKALEETHNNLKSDFEKKAKTLAQKTGEVKTLTQNIRKLEEKNQELSHEVLDLNIKIQQLENDIATSKVQKHKNNQMNTSQQLNESSVAYPVLDKTNEENEFWEQTKKDFQKVLTEFAAKEAEFDKIKQKFIEQIISLNEKISTLEKKNANLGEENSYLQSQLALHVKSSNILNDKIRTLETSLQAIHYDSQDDSDHEDLQLLNKRTSVKKNVLRENNHILTKHNIIDEMRPPADYEYNSSTKYHSNGQFSDNTFKSNNSFNRATNVFTNNILEMISPEMLSAEDTVNLMVEVLRRANQSSKLAGMLGTCEEFKTLTRSIKRQLTNPDSDYETTTTHYDTMSTMSGRVRRQKIGGVSRSFVDH